MSRPLLRSRCLCAALRRATALLMLCAANIQAQDKAGSAKPAVAELRRRADSLLVELEKATVAVEERRRLDSLRKPARDTLAPQARWVEVGPLRILTDTLFTKLVERGAQEALQSLHAHYGSATEQLRGTRFRAKARLDTVNDAGDVRTYLDLFWSSNGSDESRWTLGDTPRRARVAVLASQFGIIGDVTISTARKGPAAQWYSGGLGTGFSDEDLREGVFRALAVGSHPSGLRCLEGELRACGRVLGLESDSAGDEKPERNARLSLLRLAVAAGGEDAYSRFVADTAGNIRQRLANASGLPAEELVAHWREEVVAARPPKASTPPRTAVVAILWGALLCGVSLRSSRWR